MRLLVISRKYPPSIGGMQEFAAQFIRHLGEEDTVYAIAREVPRLLLPGFFLSAIIKGWLMRKTVQVIHLCDGALAPLGLILKVVTRKPAAITLFGLDLVYRNGLYQRIIPFCLRRLDKVICTCDVTKSECVKRGVSEDRLCVIPFGICDDLYQPVEQTSLRQQLADRYGVPRDAKVLLSVGRLIERKGFHWFLSEVLPRLLQRRQDLTYLLVGPGPLEPLLQRIIHEKRLSAHVKLLGGITDRAVLALLYNAADLFLMPNVPVTGDLEGFGVVLLEAASCGVPVIASKLDGIVNAVTDGQNGFLVEPLNAMQFADTILSLLDRRPELTSQVRRYTLEHYAWRQIVEQYRRQFQRVQATGRLPQS